MYVISTLSCLSCVAKEQCQNPKSLKNGLLKIEDAIDIRQALQVGEGKANKIIYLYILCQI